MKRKINLELETKNYYLIKENMTDGSKERKLEGITVFTFANVEGESQELDVLVGELGVFSTAAMQASPEEVAIILAKKAYEEGLFDDGPRSQRLFLKELGGQGDELFGVLLTAFRVQALALVDEN